MKNYKVEATMKFTDKEENTKRNVGDVFEVTEARYNFLKSNNAVRLVEIVEEQKEEITEAEVQAVAVAIVEQAEEDNKSVEEVVNEIVEESEDVQWAVTEEDDAVHVRPVVDGEIVDTPVETVEEPRKKKTSKK